MKVKKMKSEKVKKPIEFVQPNFFTFSLFHFFTSFVEYLSECIYSSKY